MRAGILCREADVHSKVSSSTGPQLIYADSSLHAAGTSASSQRMLNVISASPSTTGKLSRSLKVTRLRKQLSIWRMTTTSRSLRNPRNRSWNYLRLSCSCSLVQQTKASSTTPRFGTYSEKPSLPLSREGTIATSHPSSPPLLNSDSSLRSSRSPPAA